MSVVIVGLNSRTLPADLRQRVALDEPTLVACLERVAKSDHITEVVVLSTCMRTEVYVDAVRFHGAVEDIRTALADVTGLSMDELGHHFLELHEESAFRHLFRVTAGLESAVVGEAEILGQVARAWDRSRQAHVCRTVLSSLFRAAVEAGKRVRHETGVSRGTTSIAQAAVTMVNRRLDSLAGKSVLVVGAGDMGNGMATALRLTEHVGRIQIANRNGEKAMQLADRISADVVPFDQVGDVLLEIDVVLSSTGATDYVIPLSDIEAAMEARPGRPLVLVDMAVPHDVDPKAREVDGVSVLDLTDLESFTAVGKAQRLGHVGEVEAILDEVLDSYLADVNSRLVAPTIAAMRDRFESVRKAEIDRLYPVGSAEHRQADIASKALMNKVLHEPTIRLKRSAGTPEGERMADALRLLFGL